MAHTVEQFAKECKEILGKENNPAGRNKICALLQEYLKDASFVEATLDDKVTERTLLYEDPDLGFCVLGHNYKGEKGSPPHDHGPAWAIYGQARGETEMTDWELVEPASEQKAGKVRRNKVYKLTPGMAYVYNEKDLHSPYRAGSTSLIRIEGLNMDKVKRLRFEAIA
jgi:predicted metal-dependent enzyme (double-stranded beta helix superfamily)